MERDIEILLDGIDDPIETVILAIGFIAIRMVLGPIEMITGREDS